MTTKKHTKPLKEGRYPTGWGRNGAFEADNIVVNKIQLGDYAGWVEIGVAGKRGAFNSVIRLHPEDAKTLARDLAEAAS